MIGMLRDRIAGLAVMIIGLGTAAVSRTYLVGTLINMGPGYFPLMMGLILAALGLLVALVPSAEENSEQGEGGFSRIDMRGGLCIVIGVLAFLLLAKHAGLLPAGFACIFIAALGDKSASLKECIGLAAIVSIFGSILFSSILGIPLPIAAWPL